MVTQLFVGEMSQKFGLIISNLWNDPNTKQAYELLIARPKTHAASPLENTVLDSAEYFLESIDRLSAPDYIPSDEDLLRYFLYSLPVEIWCLWFRVLLLVCRVQGFAFDV